MITFAKFTNPGIVGIYSWVALAYTFYQALAENALRNQIVMSLTNERDTRAVRRLGAIAAWFGAAFMAAVLIVLCLRTPHLGSYVIALSPMVLVPFITTAGIVPVGKMQYGHRWKALARYQLLAAVVGLMVSFSIVITLHSSLAMAAHLVVTESLFLLLAHRAARSIRIEQRQGEGRPRGEVAGLSLLGVLGWTQGQLERVFIGTFAGTSVLGLYSTASAMGRSPGDALSSATANYLRASVVKHEDPDRQALDVRRIGLISAGAAVCAVLMMTVIVDFLFRPFLGERWEPTLVAVPMLAVATIPYAVSLCLQMLSIYEQNTRASIVPALLAICCAPVTGYVALHSLTGAAAVVVGKELMVLLVCYGMSRPRGAAAPVLAACALSGLAAAVVLALS
ncbi:lipopolysaccharide biosynthesis protein [Arsenicicoccus cauae]|nr:oligosaccharide flippase family protein [Arsenicicoccus cauae]